MNIKVLLDHGSEYKSGVSWNIESQPWATRHERVAALISADTILYDIRFFFFWLLWIGCSRCIDNSRSVFYVIISIQVATLALHRSRWFLKHCNIDLCRTNKRPALALFQCSQVFQNSLGLRWILFPIKSVKPYKPVANRVLTTYGRFITGYFMLL